MNDFSDFEALAAPLSPIEKALNDVAMVYIVDDEPEIVEILNDIILSAGFQTKTFTDPNHALAAFREQTPDLVVSDIKMPEMTGLELLKNMKSINSDVPLILVSGYLDTAKLLEAISSGVFSAIEKPFQADKIVAVCTQAIQLCQTNKLLSRSLNLLVYEFEDLKEYLVSNNKVEMAETIHTEIKTLLKYRRKIMTLNSPQ